MKNLILDIGNVICEWNPERLVAGVFSEAEAQQEALEHVIGHSDWRALDQGTLSLEKARDNACTRCGLPAEKIMEVYESTPSSLVAFPHMVETIEELHEEGVPLYVLSNMQEHAWRYLEETYDFWSLFEGIVISSEIKLIKPDPAIYEHITETYDLDPEETVFVDDTLENVEAAREFGIDAIHLHSGNGHSAKIHEALGL